MQNEQRRRGPMRGCAHGRIFELAELDGDDQARDDEEGVNEEGAEGGFESAERVFVRVEPSVCSGELGRVDDALPTRAHGLDVEADGVE